MSGKTLAALVVGIAGLTCAGVAPAQGDPLLDPAVARVREAFKVDGIALFDPHATHAARMGICAPSVFAGLKWCVSGAAEEKSGAAAYIKTTGYNINADNRIVYAISSRRSYPLKREEFDGIVQAIGERFGASGAVYALKKTSEESGNVDSLIAVWGGLRLVHLSEAEYAIVEGGGSLKRGHLVDHRFSLVASAKQRDPVYKIEGEAGFILHLMSTSPDRADVIARAVYQPVFLPPPGKPGAEANNALVTDTVRRPAPAPDRGSDRSGDRANGGAVAEEQAKRIEAERGLAAERLLREEAERKAAAAEAARKAALERAARAEAELKANEERHRKEEDERKKAEERAKRAERERMSSEARRQAEEAERKQAEERAKRAEVERKVLEERQRKEEAERKQAEDRAKRAEGERKSLEDLRKKEEGERKAAEERAKRAEDERKAAEEKRREEETQRKSAEERAKKAEDEKKAADERRAAEQKRAQEEAERKAEEEKTRRADAERAAEEGRKSVDEGDAERRAEGERLARERAERPESWRRLAADAAKSAGAIWSLSESQDRVADERTLRSQTIFGERNGTERLAVEVTFECTIVGRDRRLRALARGFDRKSGSGVAFRTEAEGAFGVRTRFKLDDQPAQEGLLFRERQDDTASILELPMTSTDLGKKAPRAGIWLRHYSAALEMNLVSGTVSATITPYADNLRRVLEACAQ